MAVARRDHLIKEVRSRLIEGQVAEFVANQERGLGVGFQLADQRVIDVGSQEMIEHVHGGGEEHTLIGLTGAPCNDLGEESFPNARISDEHEIDAFGQKREIEQA